MDLNRTIGGVSLLRLPFMNDPEVIEIIDSAVEWLKKYEKNTLMYDALKLLKDPDRVKIVRCEDCEHWTANNDEEGDNSGVCTNFGHSITTDGMWFCADGEEKDDDEA